MRRLRAIVRSLSIGGALALAACSQVDGSGTSAGVADSPAPAASAAALRDRAVAFVGNVDAGKAIFATNCATCHGATGVEGGVGPSLRDERERKNLDATIDWIEHPQRPMPALYPGILNRDEVGDLAAYVQSL